MTVPDVKAAKERAERLLDPKQEWRFADRARPRERRFARDVLALAERVEQLEAALAGQPAVERDKVRAAEWLIVSEAERLYDHGNLSDLWDLEAAVHAYRAVLHEEPPRG